MVQTNVYLCNKDLKELVNELIVSGCRIVPDLKYDQPKYLKLESWSEVRQIVRAKPNNLLFVVSDWWERAPLEMRVAAHKGRSFYFISQKNGGPTIDIFVSQPTMANGQALIGQGFIAYYPRFWNPLTKRMELPPTEMVSCYKGIVKCLRENGRSIKLGSKTFVLTANSERAGLPLAGISETAFLNRTRKTELL